MNNNWKKYKFSDFVEINPTIRFSKDEQYSFVEMKDLNESNKFTLPSTEKKVTGGARFEEKDTLFARITPCLQNGKICQVKGLKNSVGFGSTEFLIFRGKKDISYTDFVYYLSREEGVRRFAEQNMIGTSGRQRVVKDAFQNLELILPPLPEQIAIAEILSALDDKIELNLQTNKTLEEMANALYKHWFVDFGPFQNGKFVESELGLIPEGWEVKTLREITHVITKGTTPTTLKKQFVEEGINFVKVESIEESGNFLTSKFAHIDEDTDELLKRSRIQKNDILITIAGTIGRIAIVPEFILPANTNQAIGIMRPNEKLVSPLYLMLSMKNERIREQLFSKVVESVQANLSLGIIGETKLVIPKINNNEVKIVLSEISDLYKLIESKTIENQTLKQTRDYLLPKLISGEIRVKDALKKSKATA